MQHKIKHPEPDTASYHVKTEVLPGLISVIEDCMNQSTTLKEFLTKNQIDRILHHIYEDEAEHLLELLYVIHDAEPYIQKLLLTHLQQSDIEFSVTKREVLKDYKDGVTDPVRIASLGSGHANERKVIQEQ